MGFFKKVKYELFKPRKGPISGIKGILSKGKKITEVTLEELEDTLILSDIGVNAAEKIISEIRSDMKINKISDSTDILKKIKQEMVRLVTLENHQMNIESCTPFVIIVVGVNGSGKTTTIGKLANRLQKDGKKVLIAAGDTFRAGAIEQLKEWTTRSNAKIVYGKEGTVPSAVVFDAVQAAKTGKYDVLIIDTAGRLQTQHNLMEELKKLRKIIGRDIPEAPHETLLVLDATTGQNALSQAKLFNDATPLTGIVLTKLDGTAKGGIAISLANEMKLPIKMLGFGEGIDDICDFEPNYFINSLFQAYEQKEME